MTPRDRAAGLTLVEMLVALVLFALVGLASFTTLDAIIRTRERTEGRLELIARYDRALLLFGRDALQADPAGLTLAAEALTLTRTDGTTLTWTLAEGRLDRQIRRPTASLDQALLENVAGLQFRGLDDQGSWVDSWPPETEAGTTLRGVEMILDLGEAGRLARLAELAAPVPDRRTFDPLSAALGAVAPDAVPAAVPPADEVPETDTTPAVVE